MRNKVIGLLLAPVLTGILCAGCTTQGTAVQPQQTDEVAQEPSVTKATVEGQSIGLTSVENARELGGYTAADGRSVRRGALLRTAALSELSPADKERLADGLGLATVVDFRTSSEVEQAADPSIEGVRSVGANIIDEQPRVETREQEKDNLREGDDSSDKLVRVRMLVESGFLSDHMYVDWLSSDTGKEGYRTFFEELEALPKDRSLLFHCSQGKDRTGVAAMLILSVLGVDEQTIMEDYLLTNEFNSERIAEEKKMLEENGITGDEAQIYLIAMDQVDERMMTNALEWLKENYGSPATYVTEELGVSEAQIQALRDKFLE